MEYKDTLAKYLSRLDEVQRESFAPLDILVAHSLVGFDLQVLALVQEGQEPTADTIFGLVIFNEEASAIKTAAGTSSLKVILHHVSCLQIEQREKLFDNAMEYIWKHTHCSAIRVSLYHSKSKDSGMLQADPALKQFLKSRKFKWKTVVNDVSSGSRSEILEVANLTFQHQMRKSKAQVFRPGLSREDILREPLSMFFNSIAAFGKSKAAKDESNAPRAVPIESQANVIANLIIYKQQEGAAGGEADVIGAETTRISEIEQEVNNGFLDSLSDALKKYESELEEGNSKRVTCILPRTTFEFEKSGSLQKIRAIRGLTPDKDIQIKLSDDSIALMASKVFHDSRFKAISTANR